jgi:phosphohistidine phosphatase
MILYIIRHAWAEEHDSSRWPDDALRPLTDEGQKRFAKVLKRLTKIGFEPAVIATSPLVRCRQTAELIAKRLDDKPTIVQLDALAPSSDLRALIEWTSQQGETDVAWVGHAPDVSHLAAQLIGTGDSAIRFAKGAVAAIQFDEQIQPGGGELQWLATAKLLGE